MLSTNDPIHEELRCLCVEQAKSKTLHPARTVVSLGTIGLQHVC